MSRRNRNTSSDNSLKVIVRTCCERPVISISLSSSLLKSFADNDRAITSADLMKVVALDVALDDQ